MDWTEVAGFLRTKRCSVMKRTGVCGCPAKEIGACDAAELMACACEDMEEGLEPRHPLEDILRLLRWKQCGAARRGGCKHRLCNEAEGHAAFVEAYLGGVKRRGG